MAIKNVPLIQTGRLLIRKIESKDINNIFKGLSHPDVIKYYGVNYQTLEATKAQMSFYANLEKEGTGIWFAICSLDNKIFYGACGLSSLNKTHKKAEIGLWLMPEFWGQGIMLEAIPIIYNFGFNTLGLHRIESIVETKNTNCKRLMSKLGFQLEGTMIDSEIKNGIFISLDIYAKINPLSRSEQ